MKKFNFVILLGLLSGFLPLGAQAVSSKEDLTILPISVYGPQLDVRVISSVDAKIQEVFVNLGRFNVLGLAARLKNMDSDTFIDHIRDMKAAGTTLPEAVKFGDAGFTQKDYLKLVGSFIVVIPQITNYSADVTGMSIDLTPGQGRRPGVQSRDYQATVETSFSILRGSDLSAIRVINIKTEGEGDSQNSATSDAVGKIPAQLSFEIRSIDEFKLRTGIIDVSGADVVLEQGKNLGILPGDEFILQVRSMVGSFETIQDAGLVVVKDVQEKYTVAQVIWGNPALGDPLMELPRFGLDLEGYVAGGFRSPLSVFDNSTPWMGVLGFKATRTRGTFPFRPYAALEVPLEGYTLINVIFLPFNLWAGVDKLEYRGPFYIQYGGGVGYSGLVAPLGEIDPSLPDIYINTHAGVRADGSIGILLGRDFKIQANAGARLMFSLNEALSAAFQDYGSYFGATTGVSFIMKY